MTTKDDKGKRRWSLMPWRELTEVVDVMDFGARKYAVDNWQTVDNLRQRYFDASLRHISAWWNGERNDPETGLHHLAHATCCLLYLMWRDNEDGEDRTQGGEQRPEIRS